MQLLGSHELFSIGRVTDGNGVGLGRPRSTKGMHQRRTLHLQPYRSPPVLRSNSLSGNCSLQGPCNGISATRFLEGAEDWLGTEERACCPCAVRWQVGTDASDAFCSIVLIRHCLQLQNNKYLSKCFGAASLAVSGRLFRRMMMGRSLRRTSKVTIVFNDCFSGIACP